jgi:excisionase family DNA binding protein
MADNLSLHNADEWPVFLSPRQVAEILAIGRTKAYELCHQQGFPAKRLGKTFRVPKKSLLKWLNNHENGSLA